MANVDDDFTILSSKISRARAAWLDRRGVSSPRPIEDESNRCKQQRREALRLELELERQIRRAVEENLARAVEYVSAPHDSDGNRTLRSGEETVAHSFTDGASERKSQATTIVAFGRSTTTSRRQAQNRTTSRRAKAISQKLQNGRIGPKVKVQASKSSDLCPHNLRRGDHEARRCVTEDALVSQSAALTTVQLKLSAKLVEKSCPLPEQRGVQTHECSQVGGVRRGETPRVDPNDVAYIKKQNSTVDVDAEEDGKKAEIYPSRHWVMAGLAALVREEVYEEMKRERRSTSMRNSM